MLMFYLFINISNQKKYIEKTLQKSKQLIRLEYEQLQQLITATELLH